MVRTSAGFALVSDCVMAGSMERSDVLAPPTCELYTSFLEPSDHKRQGLPPSPHGRAVMVTKDGIFADPVRHCGQPLGIREDIGAAASRQ